MREIKFRAWDKRTKLMIHNIICGLYKTNPDLLPIMLMEWANHDKKLKECFAGDIEVRYEIMQYTGLKDKNGKEIYEGDIVKIRYYTEEGDGFYMHPDNHEIVFINEEARFKIVNRKDLMYGGFGFNEHRNDGSYVDEIEIIGNIYEN